MTANDIYRVDGQLKSKYRRFIEAHCKNCNFRATLTTLLPKTHSPLWERSPLCWVQATVINICEIRRWHGIGLQICPSTAG